MKTFVDMTDSRLKLLTPHFLFCRHQVPQFMAHVTPMSSHVPNIRLKKCAPWEGVRIKKHHDRQPDVGIGILIDVPCYRAGIEVSSESVQYYGEYIGHGKFKTACVLHCVLNSITKCSKYLELETWSLKSSGKRANTV